MNKNHNTNQTLIQFILRAQQLARNDAKSDRGYAMLMTSMISLAMLSMLAAYMTMTNLSRSSTNAYVDGTNTFYAAESGLNRRAQQVRDRFIDYAAPSGTAIGSTAASIANCFPVSRDLAETVNDFECRNYGFTYNNNISASRDSSGSTVLSEQNDNTNGVNYIAYTFVADKTKYNGATPEASTIPSGETYAGLKTQEYKYTIFATANANQNVASGITSAEMAAKGRKRTYDAAVAVVPAPAIAPTAPPATDAALVSSYDSKRSTADTANAGRAATNNRMNTVLQMDFKSRIVPLFQFAAFYNGDLEINSGSDMSLSGPVHTNSNLYVQPFGAVTLSFGGKVTAAGSIYNRVDAYGYSAGGSSKLLLNGTNCTVAGNCFPDYDAANQYPLSTGQINVFRGNVKDKVAGTTVLNVPAPGFLRKRNYADNKVGDYYAKADMRLEMVPDRRNAVSSIIPFNFTAIRTGGTGTCSTTLPTQAVVSAAAPRVSIDRDPANTYIDPDRKDASTLHCNVFTKGQLQSLRQPVLVLPNSDTSLQTSENTILGKPPIPTSTPTAAAPTAPTTVMPAVTLIPTTQKIILRALQVALASTASPVVMDTLDKPFNDSTYTGAVGTPGRDFKDEFTRLLNTITTLPVTDRDKLLAGTTTPNQIASLGSAWFLPAPIQVVAPADTANIKDATNNTRGSGFYDGRERRWINVLQTNIASLSVWNRDGLYVEASTPTGTTIATTDTDLTTAYRSNDAMKNAAFNAGTGANFTDGFAFTRSTVAQISAVTPAITPKGLQTLGLGSIDTTEGGLVLHATVNDDLNGNNAISDADDVSVDTTTPIYKKNADGTDALKKNADGTNFLDASGNTVKIIIDYPRKYKNGAIYKSPFGFAFNGGNYLPGPLTLVTDQAIYVQGDFNNNGATQTLTGVNVPSSTRLPASMIGDAVTILSNECLSPGAAVATKNDLLVPKGQISCAVSPVSTAAAALNRYYAVTTSTAVNAAMLSSIPLSNGNLGDGRGFGGTNKFSGGLNNYIRMLEKWGGGGSGNPYFNYSGSFVSLSTPLESSGAYMGGNATPTISSGIATFYQIPNRNFNFDDKFSTFSNLPPLSPRAVYLQQDVFKRNYN